VLERLLTELGERSDYDAVSQCTRCGYCAQACPTYRGTGREAWSGRGRNLIVRMLIENKLKDRETAEEVLSTCLLCGACTTACPGKVPTADLVLEGRRMLRGGKAHWLASAAARLLSENPALLESLLRWAYRFKRWGLARLAARTRVLRVFGLRGLEEAALRVDEAPAAFLKEELSRDPELRGSAQARWIYFAACGPRYLLPRVGRATIRVLKALRGKGSFIEHGCCGLLAYNYGKLDAARAMARANIERFEAADRREDAPLVCDCSSCAAFMKSYPQLFLDDPKWRSRAESFAAQVQDAVEALPADKLPAGPFAETVTYHDSCRARNGQHLTEPPRAVMRALAGDRFRELPGSDQCCGGAGAFTFLHPALSDELMRSKINGIASIQARTVAASSTSCLLQLAEGLKKYYPECRVVHLCELAAEALVSPDAPAPKGPDGEHPKT